MRKLRRSLRRPVQFLLTGLCCPFFLMILMLLMMSVTRAQDFPDFDLRADCKSAVLGTPGESASFDAEVVLATSDNPGGEERVGAQGWSLSVVATGAGRITEATTQNTVGAEVDDGGLRSSGFETTHITSNCDPADPDDRRPCENNEGAVSAVILSFFKSITLPVEGEEVVLRLRVEAETPASGCVEAGVAFRDGLQVAQPVNNVITYLSQSRRDDGGSGDNDLDVSEPCTVQICSGGFLRGNCNSDVQVNLSDAVFALNKLFLGGPDPVCLKACDPNDDGAFNLTDPIFILNYLFLGGRVPSAPFPECGDDTTPDDLSCAPQPGCGA